MAFDLRRLEGEAERALGRNDRDAALRAWGRILEQDPQHVPTLLNMGKLCLRGGDTVSAKRAFQRVVDIDGSDPQQWVNLALACKALKDDAGEEHAITSALRADPMDLLALLMRGDLMERRGIRHKAASAFAAAVAVAPPLERLHPDLQQSLRYAYDYKLRHDNEMAAFVDAQLKPHFEQHDLAGAENRFKLSVDIMLGRKRRYESQSMMHHYPGLPVVEFFDRGRFPWLDAFESATDRIRDEFLAVLKSDNGFVPYITYPADAPLNQWATLNNSPDWSAYHLVKRGKVIEDHADKCPVTMGLLATAPQPDQPGRTPAAMFSLLKPKTHIPPHTGVSNVRLVTHLPLIVPPECMFRVGNTVHEWVPGTAWVFDDTIEHEAWNGSDQLRVVLIFDIWHPDLSVAERAMLTALSGAVGAFVGESDDFAL